MSTPLTDEQIERIFKKHGDWTPQSLTQARAILSTQSTNAAGPEPLTDEEIWSSLDSDGIRVSDVFEALTLVRYGMRLAAPIAQPPASPTDVHSTERSGEAMQRPAIEILRELVACRDLRNRMASLNESKMGEFYALSAEHARREPLAWNAARAIVIESEQIKLRSGREPPEYIAIFNVLIFFLYLALVLAIALYGAFSR